VQCDIAVGMDELYKRIYDTCTTSIMVFGASCSHVTEQTALASYKYNMTQVSPPPSSFTNRLIFF
jgi:hypothetical protein